MIRAPEPDPRFVVRKVIDGQEDGRSKTLAEREIQRKSNGLTAWRFREAPDNGSSCTKICNSPLTIALLTFNVFAVRAVQNGKYAVMIESEVAGAWSVELTTEIAGHGQLFRREL
jgi:hypothetical protein